MERDVRSHLHSQPLFTAQPQPPASPALSLTCVGPEPAMPQVMALTTASVPTSGSSLADTLTEAAASSSSSSASAAAGVFRMKTPS